MRRIAVVLSCVTTLAPVASRGATFVVDAPYTCLDTQPDIAPGDGACRTASGNCTLTAALQESEALAGPDEIINGGCLDEPIVVLDDLIIRRGSGARSIGAEQGSPGALTVAGGGRLRLVEILAHGVIAETGGTLIMEPGAAQVRADSYDPLLIVRGGRVEIRGADLWCEPHAGLRVEAGELVVEDSAFFLYSFMGSRLLTMTGGTASFTRCRLEGAVQSNTWDGLLMNVEGGALILDRCHLESQPTYGNHAGIAVGPSGSAELRRCTLENLCGFAISSAGRLVAEDCRIRDTSFAAYRGAVAWDDWDGHAIRVTGGTARIVGCRIESTRATTFFGDGTGRTWGFAAGAGLVVSDGDVTCVDTTITGGRATGVEGSEGAGVHVSGGRVRLERCLVAGNAASEGSEVTLRAGELTLVNTSIVGGGWSASDVLLLGGSTHLWSSVITRRGTTRPSARVVVDAAALLTASSSILDGCEGQLESLGHVLVEQAADCVIAGDMTGVRTGVLAGLDWDFDASSPIPTLPLTAGAAARDAADPLGSRDDAGALLVTDARGWTRVVDGDGDAMARADLGPREECYDAADLDMDGLGDACDGCPGDADRGTDADHDGLDDACDGDDTDGDGLADRDDACPGAADPAQDDADADGVGDACDGCPVLADDGADRDADGRGDACESCPDHSDPVPADRDGDGVDDACDKCWAVADTGQEDSDADGVGDACDNCVDVPNTAQHDTDWDTVGDSCDSCGPSASDRDRDATCDDADNCPSRANPDQRDADGDGIGDACDDCRTPFTPDADRDGIPDACDLCRLEADPAQADTDRDATGDACDSCPADFGDQADSDGDGTGDACDATPAPEPENFRVTKLGEFVVRLQWVSRPGVLSELYSVDLADVSEFHVHARWRLCGVSTTSHDMTMLPGNVAWIVGGQVGSLRTLGADSFGVPRALPVNPCP